jgi:hypothetical protein
MFAQDPGEAIGTGLRRRDDTSFERPWNRFGHGGLIAGAVRGESCMHLHIYRDESRSRHIDLISGGERPRSFDLVLAITSGILLVGFACAVIVPFVSTVPSLTAWVR